MNPELAKFNRCLTHGFHGGSVCPLCPPAGRTARPAVVVSAPVAVPTQRKASNGLKKARGMNKTEARFAELLEARKQRGEILSWRYEGIRLKWGEDKDGNCMHYCPDFLVQRECGLTHSWDCIEVKGGHIRDRDVVRFKGARADWHEMEFELWQWKKGAWTRLH